MKKIVIFDMDGTLIDTKKDITISINYVRDIKYNLNPVSEAFVVESINKEIRNLPKLFYDTELYEDDARVIFEKHYKKQCVQNPYLYDGILQVLLELKSKNVKMSVATNAPTKFAQIMLKYLQVDKHFDMILGADKVKNSKPDPQMLNDILYFYGYEKNSDKAWMIGDNSKDMLSAKNAQINSIFATWGFSPNGEHDTLVLNPKDILDIVL